MNNNITSDKYKPYQIGNIAKKCNDLSNEILVETLQYLDEVIMESRERRINYKVKGFYKRTITTMYGTITYKRRLYQNKDDKTYTFLLDLLVGIDPYSRLTDDAVLAIAEAAVECKSYRIAGLYALSNTIVSRQTVYKCLDKVEFIKKEQKEINANIIHVAVDGFFANYKEFKRKVETKFANIYTGIEKVTPKRNQLTGKTVINQSNLKDFKDILLETLQNDYKIKENTKIFICGDGASWIKNLINDIPNSEFIIDKFHYKRALRNLPNPTEAFKAFKNNDLESLASQIKDCSTQYHLDNLQYVTSNFEFTKHWNNENFICCAAENVVSHVYNHRIRGIPRNWGKNLFKVSTALALKSTNSFDIELTNISNEKLVSKYQQVSDLFKTFTFDSYKEQIPVLKYKNTGLRSAITNLIY